jgi:predicted nucleic acid-binding protein
LNLYFDTSFLAPLILQETTSEDVEKFIATLSPEQLCISQWTRVEFASLVAREVRMGKLPAGRGADGHRAVRRHG